MNLRVLFLLLAICFAGNALAIERHISQLDTLAMYDPELFTIERDGFSHILDLSGVRLTDITGISQVLVTDSDGKIKPLNEVIHLVLNLNDNQLSHLPPEICTLSHLTKLYLDNNQLSVLPVEMAHLTNLRVLDIRNNRICRLPLSMSTLKHMEFKIQGNRFEEIPSLLTLDLSGEFHVLNLSKCGLTHITGISNLQVIDIDGQCKPLREISDLIIDLNDNHLEILPDEIGQLENLIELRVEKNPELTALPLQVITQLPLLRRVHWENNANKKALAVGIKELTDLKKLIFYSKKLKVKKLGKLRSISLNLIGLHTISGIAQLHVTDFDGIDKPLSQISNLSLSLAHNMITQLPTEIGQLNNLIELHLNNNQLRDLPGEIGKLNNLRELHLNNNQLRDLPVKIGQLKKLVELDISHNNISRFPAEIALSPMIEKLNWSHNLNPRNSSLTVNGPKDIMKGSGNIIHQVGNLSKLRFYPERLILKNRTFPCGGSLCGECSTYNLNFSDLHLDDITGILNLKVTDLDGKVKPISRISNLRLNLSNNNLSALPAEILQLKNIEAINIENNKFKKLPIEILKLPLLQECMFHGNLVEKLPDSIEKLEDKMKFYTHRLKIVEIRTFPRAKCIDLSGINLTHINGISELMVTCHTQKMKLRDVDSLVILLNDNLLDSIPLEIEQIPGLVGLDISTNNLTDIGVLEGNKNLKYLRVDNNRLTHLSQEIIGMPFLRCIYWQNNPLTQVPTGIGQLKDLSKLKFYPERLLLKQLKMPDNNNQHLPVAPVAPRVAQYGIPALAANAQNPLAYQFGPNRIPAQGGMQPMQRMINNPDLLNFIPDLGVFRRNKVLPINDQYNEVDLSRLGLTNMVNLTELKIPINGVSMALHEIPNLILDLSYNCITELSDEVCELRNLVWLDISNNQLSELPAGIRNLQNLRVLNLNDNNLTTLPASLCQLHLYKLYLDNNQLTSFPADWGNLKYSLKEMGLSGNGLMHLPESIEQLRALSVLYLRHNKLTSLEGIGLLTNLTILDLSWNKLMDFPLEICLLTKLKWLGLIDIGMKELPADIGLLRDINWLSLVNNTLTYLPEEISDLFKLTELYVGGNQLTQLPQGIGKLAMLKRLDVRNNKLAELPASLVNLQKLEILKVFGNSALSLRLYNDSCLIYNFKNGIEARPEDQAISQFLTQLFKEKKIEYFDLFKAYCLQRMLYGEPLAIPISEDISQWINRFRS